MKTLFAPFPQRLKRKNSVCVFSLHWSENKLLAEVIHSIFTSFISLCKGGFPVTFALHQCLSVHAIGRRQSYEYHMTSVTYLNDFTHWLLSDSDLALNQWPRSKQWYAVNPTTTTHTESILGKQINNVRTQLL